MRMLLLCNGFVLLSGVLGIARTVRFAAAAARLFPLAPRSLDRLDRRLSRLYRRRSRWLVASDQPCLGSGLVLFFYARRMRRHVRLVVGGRQQGDAVVWHCWIAGDGAPRGDSADELGEYVPMLEYA